MSQRAVLCAAIAVCSVAVVPAIAAPLYVDDTNYVDLQLSVTSSIGLVPGQTGFVNAVLRNDGNTDATFKQWDDNLSFGGFGWDFNSPGLAVGFGGRAYVPNYPLGFGMAEGTNPSPSTVFATPDFSALDNVVIAPGQSIDFTLFSMLLSPSTSIGTSFAITTNLQLAIGSPVYRLQDSVPFSIQVSAVTLASAGPMLELQFGPATCFSPACLAPTSVPEPGTLALLGLGLVGVRLARRRMLN